MLDYPHPFAFAQGRLFDPSVLLRAGFAPRILSAVEGARRSWLASICAQLFQPVVVDPEMVREFVNDRPAHLPADAL